MAFERTSDFSFRGVHISNFGVHYVPERKDWHIWEHNYKTSESSGDGHDGAQWDGNTVEPKEFVLRLYYEEIPERWLSAAISLFERTGSGELIFDERPWLVYIARPFKAVVVEKYPHGDGVFNGFITVSLKAYYPFALSSFNTLDDNVEYPHLHERLMATSALLPANRMPVNATGTKTAQFTYNAYNGGTARADTIIKIAGNVGAGIDIYNMLTKQWCRVIGLT